MMSRVYFFKKLTNLTGSNWSEPFIERLKGTMRLIMLSQTLIYAGLRRSLSSFVCHCVLSHAFLSPFSSIVYLYICTNKQKCYVHVWVCACVRHDPTVKTISSKKDLWIIRLIAHFCYDILILFKQHFDCLI